MKILISYMPISKNLAMQVSDFLMTYKTHPELMPRENLKLILGYDLVISIGGDGTFLHTAKFIDDNSPIVGINFNKKISEGFYLILNSINWQKGLKKIIDGKIKLKKLIRVECQIGKIKLRPIINEYYVGCRVPYHMSEYWLYINGKKQYQRSSGVLIGTSSGAKAWSKAAGGYDIASNKFQVVVREPYTGRLIKFKRGNTVLSKNDSVKIISDVSDGIIVGDAQEPAIPFAKGVQARFQISKKNLMIYW